MTPFYIHIPNLEHVNAIKNLLSENKLTIELLSNQVELLYNDILTLVIYLIYTNEIQSDYAVKPFGRKTEVWI